MPEEKIYEDLSLIRRRANAVFLGVGALVFLALAFYWKVQILESPKYRRLAEANQTRTRILTAPRGLIRDRHGKILADNTASFKVSLVRENIRDMEALSTAVNSLLGISREALQARISRYKAFPLSEPVVIKDGLGPMDIAPIESRRREYPELIVEAEPQRHYPFGTFAAHILGYLQERTPDDVSTEPDRGLRAGEMGGKTGVEKACDPQLTGRGGYVLEIVDSLGKRQDVRERVNPVQGGDVVLTIDSDYQRKAEEVLQGREGAVVVLDPRNGGILAMASFPTFDPNQFITRFTPEEWLKLVGDPASPLENRSIRGLYAPGSIFKLIMGLGGLDFGYVTSRNTVYCSGSIEIYGFPFKCWFEPGHGAMDLAGAIQNSCNIYFYTLGRQMGIDTIAMAAERMGLGQKTGVDLPGEKDGLVPSTAWKKKALRAPWYPGETISVSIGQGQLQVTPLQLAAMTAIIANQGKRVRPHVVFDPGDPPPGKSDETPPFKPATFEQVIEGMWRSVNRQGTGQAAMVPGLDVCGKTGSTQVISRVRAEQLAKLGREIKTHSWFSGFAPRENPRFVVTVLVEYGGAGGATAAPLAGRIFEQCLREMSKQ